MINTMGKKGDIWISAILYLALGLIIISILLAIAMPVVGKYIDQNIFRSSKGVMQTLDENIVDVSNDGPGSARFISPFSVEKGKIIIDEVTNTIVWNFETSAELVSPGIEFKEGNLVILLSESSTGDDYVMTITRKFSDDESKVADLIITENSLASPFQGVFSLKIENTGFSTEVIPKIELTVS